MMKAPATGFTNGVNVTTRSVMSGTLNGNFNTLKVKNQNLVTTSALTDKTQDANFKTLKVNDVPVLTSVPTFTTYSTRLLGMAILANTWTRFLNETDTSLPAGAGWTLPSGVYLVTMSVQITTAANNIGLQLNNETVGAGVAGNTNRPKFQLVGQLINPNTTLQHTTLLINEGQQEWWPTIFSNVANNTSQNSSYFEYIKLA